MVTNFRWFLVTSKIDRLHSLLQWRSETDAISPYVCVNSGTNASTSCTNLVKIGLVAFEENRPQGGLKAQFDDRRSFCTLSFSNGLEFRDFDFS